MPHLSISLRSHLIMTTEPGFPIRRWMQPVIQILNNSLQVLDP